MYKDQKELKEYYDEKYVGSDFEYDLKSVVDRIYNIMDVFKHEQNARLLDLGCGRGLFAKVFHDSGIKNVFAVDFSISGLAYCKRNYQGVMPVNADAFYMPFKENSINNA